ncbi:hypothetical protein [Candidatus Enterococcus clewellii]|uniref:Uncharacterized protein n=1 Tax=Candidatus Enterococcus clewellii TaxID=1834193 RepID=A0AAQ3XYZ0_9ENTE
MPNKKKLEETIYKALEKDYLVTFKWEAAKELGVEALIIPKPFYPIFNKDKIEEINVPATLFINENVEEIKQLIDDHFKNKLK